MSLKLAAFGSDHFFGKWMVGGRQFAGFDEGGGIAGDDGSGFVEEVGFGFGVGSGEVGGVAKGGEEISGRILHVVNIFKSHFGKRGQTCFPKIGMTSFAGLQPPYLPIHKTSVPETLPEVPHPTGVAVEEAEVEEVADAEVGEGAEVGREAVVLCLAGVLECAGESLLRFALSIATMLLFPPFKRV